MPCVAWPLLSPSSFFGPGGLRAPCVLECAMPSLAIVITIVQSLLFFFFSPSFAFDLLREISRVCKFVSPIFWHNSKIYAKKMKCLCVLGCAMRSLAIVITIVQSFSLSSSSPFSPSFAFDPLWGNSHVRNNFCPNILAYLEDICKKNIFGG